MTTTPKSPKSMRFGLLMMAFIIVSLVAAAWILIPDQLFEDQDESDGLLTGSISVAGCSLPCAHDVVSAETRGDNLMPIPEGVDTYYWIDGPLMANETSDWYAPVANTTLYANSAGKWFWVCFESAPGSLIAEWCSHRYTFQGNESVGWDWQSVSTGTLRIQFRADVDDTIVYMANVPNPPDYGRMG